MAKARVQYAEIEYLYRPLYRPASTFTLPRDITWDYVEAPRIDPMIAVRRNLPLSTQMYGIIAVNRQLTSDEREQYGLAVC